MTGCCEAASESECKAFAVELGKEYTSYTNNYGAPKACYLLDDDTSVRFNLQSATSGSCETYGYSGCLCQCGGSCPQWPISASASTEDGTYGAEADVAKRLAMAPPALATRATPSIACSCLPH